MRFWSVTDPGCVRAENQDAHSITRMDRNTVLFVVCDGMGGAKAGNVASALASESFTQQVQTHYRSALTAEMLDLMLDQAVQQTNFTVYDQAGQSEEYAGMGTTLAAVLLRGKMATVVNVGDSRVYRINDDGITQITVDHSLVQLMIQRGELPPERARSFPGKNYITRAVGTEATVKCDVFHLDLKRGDHLLICSDGLTNLVHDQEILFETVYGGNKADCCQRLLDIAKNRGAPDNVTAILVQV